MYSTGPTNPNTHHSFIFKIYNKESTISTKIGHDVTAGVSLAYDTYNTYCHIIFILYLMIYLLI